MLYDRNHPFLATIVERYPLCKSESGKESYHVVLSLKGSNLSYEVGESIGVLPDNDLELVERTLSSMRLNGEEIVVDSKTGESMSIRHFLTKKANINECHKKLIEFLRDRQKNGQKKAKLTAFLENTPIDELRNFLTSNSICYAFKENPEVDFIAQDVADLLRPLLPRFYSIASAQIVSPEEVHLTVAYVKYGKNGERCTGVCSHFLCTQAPLGEPVVPIYIQSHRGFTLPKDPTAPIIMVGPGTGIAPFRGFLQERMAKNAEGKNWLFFGDRFRAHHYFYSDFFEKLKGFGRLQIHTAFSRDQKDKIYVQHRMKEHGQELFSWLERGSFFYVCGDAKVMAKDVEKTLHEIVAEQGKMTEEASKIYVKNLRKEKRYLKDVY